MMKSYTEMIETAPTYLERFNYLKLQGVVAEETFGSHRYLNQLLYKCPEWKAVRRDVILRDGEFDLGCPDRRLGKGERIYIHHINPITVEQILNRDPIVFDLDNLILCGSNTHRAIHYGDEDLLYLDEEERCLNDTIPWR